MCPGVFCRFEFRTQAGDRRGGRERRRAARGAGAEGRRGTKTQQQQGAREESGRMAAQYSFPTLENREILECMSELGCSISEEQLTKPTPDHIMRVMEQLLDLFMGFSADDNAQIKFSGMDVFDHPEIHEFSVGQLAFHRSIIKLMRASGVYDFELRDISMPQHARIRKLFSAVINFAKFREEKVATFEQFVESTEALQNQKAEVDSKFEQLNAQLTQLRAQRKQEEPIIEELHAENEKMESQIRSLNQEQSSLKTKIHDMKHVRQEVTDKRDHDQFAILNLRAEISKLQSLVVRSPERVKKEISEMSSAYEADNTTLREMDDKLKTLQTKVDGLNKTEKVPCHSCRRHTISLFVSAGACTHVHSLSCSCQWYARVFCLNAPSFARTCQSSSSSSRKLRSTWASSRARQRK